ncbi:MAG: class I SAM-dependent methyltransferase [Candidatus Levyibacteriota bacterium]
MIQSNTQKTKKYFNNLESRLGYAFVLKGRKHLGFYPEGKENISTLEAQKLMEDKLAQKLNVKENALVLDAGCGEGKVAIYLAKEYRFQIKGIDLLDWAIKNAKQNAAKEGVNQRTEFRVMDYSHLEFPDNTFDAVYTMETLVHAPHYKQVLHEFHRVLKPKGKLVLFEYSISPENKIPSKLKKILYQTIQNAAMPALFHFTHGTFPSILKEAGFTSIEVEDVSLRIIPLLEKFSRYADLPYKMVRLFRLQDYFVNATASFLWKDVVKKKIWKHNIVVGTKAS